MALINCSNCGKEISDKALTCPGCGFSLEKKIDEKDVEPILCDECGKEIEDGCDSCSNCGCPVTKEQPEINVPQKVELAGISLPKNRKVSGKTVGIVITIVSILVIALIIGLIAKGDKKNQYHDTLQLAATNMLVGATEAEDACNLIKAVWYNTIYEEYDTKTDKYTRSNGYRFNDDSLVCKKDS
jgi:uncharacterized membrane protein YvbJ